jgi:hypothetical protein
MDAADIEKLLRAGMTPSELIKVLAGFEAAPAYALQLGEPCRRPATQKRPRRAPVGGWR